MNQLIKNNSKIEDMIYEIRGKQVMLDSDLARLYQCKNGTKSINLAVKRHINRFPERFMFQLTEDETKSKNIETRGGKYNKHYNNLKLIFNKTFHDRYFIIDEDIVYHCGASINRIGYKTFSINLISDENIKKSLMNEIKILCRDLK